MATFVFCFLVGTANRLNLTLLGFGFARLGCLAAQIELLSRNFLSLTLAPRIAASSSKNAVNNSSARTMKHFPSPRCASAIHIVRLLESTTET